MISSGTFKTFAIAASFGAFVVSPCEVIDKHIAADPLKYKDSISQNWREFGSLNVGSSTYTVNAEIKSVVGLASDVLLSSFDDEMDAFWKSLDDGTIFNSVGVEVWEVAKRIVAAKPDITDYI